LYVAGSIIHTLSGGYFGSNCATHFGVTVPPISV